MRIRESLERIAPRDDRAEDSGLCEHAHLFERARVRQRDPELRPASADDRADRHVEEEADAQRERQMAVARRERAAALVEARRIGDVEDDGGAMMM